MPADTSISTSAANSAKFRLSPPIGNLSRRHGFPKSNQPHGFPHIVSPRDPRRRPHLALDRARWLGLSSLRLAGGEPAARYDPVPGRARGPVREVSRGAGALARPGLVDHLARLARAGRV